MQLELQKQRLFTIISTKIRSNITKRAYVLE
jgi:hypothetical protein